MTRGIVTEPNPDAVQELEDLMQDLSETWFATWMSGVEFALWDATQGKARWLDLVTIPDELIARARRLSEEIGGWVAWPEEWERPGYIAMGTWLERWAEYRAEAEQPAV